MRMTRPHAGAAEEEPAWLQAHLAAIVDSTDDAVMSKDLNGILVSWNGGAERLYGWTGAEAVGRHISFIIPPHRAGEEQRILDTIRAGAKVDHYRTERLRKDGSVVPVSVTVSPLRDASGQVLGASVIARDMTEQQKLEQLRDEFIANAAHELRTPLSTLAGYVDLLTADGEELSESERNQIHGALRRQGEHAKVLVSALLDLARAESGRVEIELRSVDLSIAVRDAVLYAPPPEGFALQVDVHGGTTVTADPLLLERAITNLVTNAYRYGGQRARVTARSADDKVDLLVDDAGPGVDESMREKLFLPFYRGRHAGNVAGTGLGLAITKELVELMGAEIRYERSPLGGARFAIRLRARPGEDLDRPTTNQISSG